MSDVDDIIARWQRGATEARKGDVEKVVKSRIAPRAKVRMDRKGTSHVINISHPYFQELSTFKGRDNFNIVLKHGRQVTKFYLQDLLAAIDALDSLDANG